MNEVAQQLCLSCGLCCNGVIFADGQLRPGDDAERLRAIGLRLKRARGGDAAEACGRKFHQPCGALDGCRCTIYSERPEYCRAFECALLKRVNAKTITPDGALRTIRGTKQRAKRVANLLQRLGCADEATALSVRFRRMNRLIHSEPIDKRCAEAFGELTLAMHRLNVVLSREFYPGSPPNA